MQITIAQKSTHRVVVVRERMFPVVELTPVEQRRLRASRKEIARGNYVTLDELKQVLARRHRIARKKIS